MSLIRRVARPLLAAPFIVEGIRTAIQPQREIEVAPAAFAELDKAIESQPSIPSFVDSTTVVRATGVVSAIAGLMYATNKAPRAAAFTLLGTTSIALSNRKKVWELKGSERLDEIQSLLADAGLLGGILLAVADTDGSPSVGYRVNKLVERGQKAADKKQKELEKKANSLSKKGSKRSRKLEKKAKAAAKDARKNAASALDSVTDAIESRLPN